MRKQLFKIRRIVYFTLTIFLLLTVTSVFGKDTLLLSRENILEEEYEVNIEKAKEKDKNNFDNNIRGLEKLISRTDKAKQVDYDEYQNILSYAVFLAENEFEPHEIEYLNTLLEEGYSEGVIIEIYEFWKTTDEDFSMIGDLCKLSDSMYGINWVENAFNKLTNYSHGVLSVEDIEKYYEQGITYEQICSANILSRKKGNTIQGILDEILSGKDNLEIIEDAGVESKNNVGRRKMENINMMFALKIMNNEHLEDEIIPLDEEDIETRIADFENKTFRNNVVMARKELAAAGIVQEEIDKAEKKRKDDASRESAIDHGLNIYQIESLRRRGYTYEEIEQAAQIHFLENINPLEAIKMVTGEGVRR